MRHQRIQSIASVTRNSRQWRRSVFGLLDELAGIVKQVEASRSGVRHHGAQIA